MGRRVGGGGGFIHPTPTRHLYNASRADEQSQEPLTCLHCAVVVGGGGGGRDGGEVFPLSTPVSYTHLTLPTRSTV